MSGLMRGGTVKPVSQDQILRRIPVDVLSATECDDYTYTHRKIIQEAV